MKIKSEKKLVILDNSTNDYIAIDTNSGHPYRVDNISNARKWGDAGEAAQYMRHFKKEDWSIMSAIITVQLTDIE